MGVSRLARVGVLGICSATLLAGLTGCSRVREQMPARRLAREYPPSATRPAIEPPVAEAGAFTSSRLAGLPLGVQASFREEHPDAQVTSVATVPSGTGPLLYRITYLEDGVPGVVTYQSSGRDLAPPPEVVIRPDDTGRPKAKYAPVPEPGIPGQSTPSGQVD